MRQSCDLSAGGLIRRWETCLEVYRSEENSITLNLNVERQSLFCNNIHGLCMLGNDKEPCFTHSQSDMVSIAGFPILRKSSLRGGASYAFVSVKCFKITSFKKPLQIHS